MKFLAEDRKTPIRSFLKKPARVLLIAAGLSLFAVFGLLFAEARLIYRKTEQTLEKERERQAKQSAVSFSRVALTPQSDKNVRIIQSTQNARGAARFQNSLFAATDGGLLQLTETGEIARHFTVLDGLPESDLTALAVFGARLFIGTKSKGLINFDGERFEVFRLENHETKSITALFADSTSLLIGTFSGGLLEFDGGRITEVKAAEARLEHVTFVRRDASTLTAGTFARGLWIRRHQIWKNFTTADGLFSNRAVGAERLGGELFVATDLGVSQISDEEISPETNSPFRRTLALPALSSMITEAGKIYLSKDDGEIFEFSPANKNSAAPGLKKIGWQAPANVRAARLLKSADEILFLTNRGIYQSRSFGSGEISLTEFIKFSGDAELTDNNVSALAIDSAQKLWVGTFRNGIDVFSAGKKLKHIESELVREINFLTRTDRTPEILAATSGGAVRFDAAANETFFADNKVLPSRSVMQIALFRKDRTQISAIATVKGLLVEEKAAWRAFSTVNGLPGNSVSALLFARDSLFVGTMSGLAQISGGKVARVYKTSNSELKNNWVSALCRAGERIFIGTYGGGVFELLPSGDVRGFEPETGNFAVNPNALFSDGERLYAGTLSGVWSLDLRTQKWSQATSVLPSETVLSITGDGENVYFGTTNGIALIHKNFWVENRL